MVAPCVTKVLRTWPCSGGTLRSHTCRGPFRSCAACRMAHLLSVASASAPGAPRQRSPAGVEGERQAKVRRGGKGAAPAAEGDEEMGIVEAGPKRAQRKKRQSGAGADDRDFLRALAKLSLKNQLELRTLSSMVFDTYLIKADNAVAVQAMAQGSAYAETVRAEGPRHERGTPHIWVWGGGCWKGSFEKARGRERRTTRGSRSTSRTSGRR